MESKLKKIIKQYKDSCNEERRVNKKTGKVNTDHRYMGIRFYFDSDSEWMKKIKQ